MATYTRQEQGLLGMLAGSKFTHIMDFMVLMPLGPQLMRTFGIDTQQFGFLVASYTLSAGVAVLFSSLFIDRLDRKKALIVVYAGFILGTLACGLAGTYEWLLLARMLTGVFGGLLNALVFSIIGDVFPIQKRAGAMGWVMAAFSAAAAFGVPFGVYMASIGQWNWPFLFLAALSLPILIGMWFFVPAMSGIKKELNAEGKGPGPFAVLIRIFKNNNQLKALGMTLSLVLGQFMLIPYISPYMVGNIGFTEMELTYIYLVGGIITLFSGPYIGRLADKYGHKKLFMILSSLSIIPLLLVTHLPAVGIPLALVVTSLFFMLISGRIIPSTTMVVSGVETRYRAGFMSVNTAMQQFAAGIAAIISGSLVTEIATSIPDVKAIVGYPLIGYFAVALTLVSMFLASMVQPVQEDNNSAIPKKELEVEVV
jgi:DHA1 family inner membrane transport protein